MGFFSEPYYSDDESDVQAVYGYSGPETENEPIEVLEVEPVAESSDDEDDFAANFGYRHPDNNETEVSLLLFSLYIFWFKISLFSFYFLFRFRRKASKMMTVRMKTMMTTPGWRS